MNAAQRTIGISLSFGILFASGSAFAHHYPSERGLPIQGMLDYDYDGDRIVTRDEFEQRELYTCRQAFLRNDPNQDSWISEAERAKAVGTYCEGWYTARDFVREYQLPTRNAPHGRFVKWEPRVVRQPRDGFGWNELRRESLVQIRRTFIRADHNHDGVINMRELNVYHDGIKRRSAERIAEANCHQEPIAAPIAEVRERLVAYRRY